MSVPYPSGYDLEYCTTDHAAMDAGCTWGVVLQQHDGSFWVLTTVGVRYYAFTSEHKFLRRGDDGYELVDLCWRQGVAEAARAQAFLPRHLRPTDYVM